MARIRAKKMKILIFDLITPFILGVLTINIIYRLWFTVHESPPPKPIVPFSINFGVHEKSSKWTKILSKSEKSSQHRIWIVTPTFYRRFQLAELTRVAQALLPASSFVTWLIYDDHLMSPGDNLNTLKTLLSYYKGLDVRVEETSPLTLADARERAKTWFPGRGSHGRRSAVQFIRNSNQTRKGVVYFADDDNTYDSEIFLQMQQTKTVSIWPVSAMEKYTISSPVVKYGQVVDFFDGYMANRKFPVDFAGFAINSSLLKEFPEATIKYMSGYMETYLLQDLGTVKETMKPLANNCTKVLAWHTKTLLPKRFEDHNLMLMMDYSFGKGRRKKIDEDLINTSVAHLYKYYF